MTEEIIKFIDKLPITVYHDREDKLELTPKRIEIIQKLFEPRNKWLVVKKGRSVGLTSFMAAVAAFVILNGWKFNYFCKYVAMEKEFKTKVIELMARIGDVDMTKSYIRNLWKENLNCFNSSAKLIGHRFGGTCINFLDESAYMDDFVKDVLSYLPFNLTIIGSTPTDNHTVFARICNRTEKIERGWLFWKKVKYVNANDVIHITWKDCPWIWRNSLTFKKGEAVLKNMTGDKFLVEDFNELVSLGWKPSCEMVDNHISASLSNKFECNELDGEFYAD